MIEKTTSRGASTWALPLDAEIRRTRRDEGQRCNKEENYYADSYEKTGTATSLLTKRTWLCF